MQMLCSANAEDKPHHSNVLVLANDCLVPHDLSVRWQHETQAKDLSNFSKKQNCGRCSLEESLLKLSEQIGMVSDATLSRFSCLEVAVELK